MTTPNKLEPITRAEWEAKVRETRAIIAFAGSAVRARERRRQERRRQIREWLTVGILFAIILLVLALAGSLD